jgi:hypothetical protein
MSAVYDLIDFGKSYTIMSKPGQSKNVQEAKKRNN